MHSFDIGMMKQNIFILCIAWLALLLFNVEANEIERFNNHEIRFVNQQFLPQLTNKNSSEYKEYESNLKRHVTDIYGKHGLRVKRFTLNSLSPGSIIANFTVNYDYVSTNEVILLQNAIEDVGKIDSMPVKQMQIVSSDVPPAPPNVTVNATSATSIEVSWDPVNTTVGGNLTVIGYIVFRKRLMDKDHAWERTPTSVNVNRINVTKLDPFTTYTFRVVAFHREGNGLASKFEDATTFEGEPDDSPMPLICESNKPTQLTLRWKRLETNSWRGYQRNYTAQYKMYTDNVTSAVKFLPQKSEGNIDNLKQFTKYTVYLMAYTNAGPGPKAWVICDTMEGVPSQAPTNIEWKLDPSRPLHIIITFTKIPDDFIHGELQGYRVYYGVSRVGKNATEFPVEKYMDVSPFATEAIIKDGTEPDMELTVQIVGFTRMGDGVRSERIYPTTCKCPASLYTAWFEKKPYIHFTNFKRDAHGLFPVFLKEMIEALCSSCPGLKDPSALNKTHTTLYWDRSRDGHTPERTSEDNLKESVANNIDIHVFMYGRAEIENFQSDYKFVSIFESSGIAFITRDHEKDLDKTSMILTSLANTWPAVVIIFVLSMLAGIAVWAADCKTNSEEFPNDNFVIGSLYHGTYWAFVSMTTVGYGDKTPQSFCSQMIAIAWMLLGPIINGIVIGTITTSLTTIKLQTDPTLYGSNVSAIANSFEYNLGVRRNANMNITEGSFPGPYNNTEEVLRAVEIGQVEGALIKSLDAASRMDNITKRGMKIAKMIPERLGDGIILSGQMLKLEEDVRSYVYNKREELTRKVKEITGNLEVKTSSDSELDTGIVDPDSDMFKNFCIYGAGTFVGLCILLTIFDYGYLRRRKPKVKPECEVRRDLLMDHLQPVATDFMKDFTENVMTKSSCQERQLKRFFWQKGYSFGMDGWFKKKTMDENYLKKDIRFSEIMRQDLGYYNENKCISSWNKGKNLIKTAAMINKGFSTHVQAFGLPKADSKV